MLDDPAGPGMPLTSLKPTLPGDRVLLRPPNRSDAHAIAALLADPELLRLTARVTTTDEAESFAAVATVELLDWYDSRAQQSDRLDLVIVDRDTGEVVGEVVLEQWRSVARSVALRILLGAARRGSGLGTEAARLVLAHGFDDLGLNRVELEVLACNLRGLRMGARLGFDHEGTRREAFWFDGRPVDEHVMSMLRSDWVGHRGHPPVGA